ncbi:MAG: ADP-ribosylation factor-like protein [Promethearchaeota archaeon]
MDNIKIIFAGLDSAGKTSFLQSLEARYSTLLCLKPTLGAERREFKIFGLKISNWDLGGQETYRDVYFKEKDRYFTKVSVLFYIIDVQDEGRIGKAFDYYRKILECFLEFNEKPKIIICWHKLDEDILHLPEYQQKIEKFEQLLRDGTPGGISYHTYKTSIFDKWSLLKAFSAGVIGLSPKKTFIDSQLRDFARMTFSSAVLLLDPNHLTIGSSTSKVELLEVCEAIVPHASAAAERLSRYDIKTENILVTLKPGKYYKDVIQGKEMVSMYVPLAIGDDGMVFSLLSLTKNPKTMKLMVKHSNALVNNLRDLIQTLYFK